MPRNEYDYIAFISYRHEAVGRKWAMWLQNSIENYRVPWALVKLGTAPRRVGKCFRDEEELAASADLSKEIDAALQSSKFLIVVCTPRTPHSQWVNEEIKRFRDLGRGDRILALLVEGQPRESFPPALMEIRPSATLAASPQDVPIQQIEPLAADIREDVGSAGGHGRGHMRSMAKLRIIAGLLGVSFDDLYNRNSRRVYGRILATAGLALTVAAGMVGLAIYAFSQRAEARSQAARAEKERDTAQFIQDFLLDDVLAGASPDNMPDKKVRDQIVKNMIDPAAAEVGQKLRDRPLVEAEARDRLGRVYEQVDELDSAVEQSRRAVELARRELPVDDPALASFINNYALRLDRSGKARDAEPLLKDVLETSRRVAGNENVETITSITNYASVLARIGRLEEAEPLAKEAWELGKKVFGEGSVDATHTANAYANVLRARGKLQEAEKLYRDVLDVRKRKLDPDDALVLSAMHNLANIELQQGKLAEAEPRGRDVLERRMRKLGAPHGETLSSMDVYARILDGLGDSADAERIASFVYSSAKASGDPRIKQYAVNLAKYQWRSGRGEEATKLLAEHGEPAPPPPTQPAHPSRPLEGEAGRFVQKLLADLSVTAESKPAAGG